MKNLKIILASILCLFAGSLNAQMNPKAKLQDALKLTIHSNLCKNQLTLEPEHLLVLQILT